MLRRFIEIETGTPVLTISDKLYRQVISRPGYYSIKISSEVLTRKRQLNIFGGRFKIGLPSKIGV